MKKLLLSALMLLSAVIVDKAYAQTPTASNLTVAPETSTSTLYKWYTMESTNDGDANRRHLFLLYDTSHDPALYTVLLTNGSVDGVNLTSGGESIPDKYLWRLEQADGGVYLVNKASDLRITVPSSATNSNNTKLTMTEAGVVWSMDSPSGNTANQYCFNYTACSTTPAYMNAMGSDQSYGVTIYSAGQQRASGWFFYKAYEEVVTEKTATPVLTLASGSNIQKGINEIGVTCANADAVIYYTTDGTEPTEGSAQVTNGKITIDATSLTLQDKVTVKAVAKATDLELSNTVRAEYVVYPYSYVPVNYTTTGGGANAANITSITTSREVGYNLNYSRAAVNDANYLQVIGAEESGFRVKRGETFDLTFMWSNAWWNGFSMFMDKGTGTLEEIFYGCGAKDDIVADTDRGEVKLADNPSDPTSKSITISPDAEYGEYMIRARVTNTHEIGVSARDQKIVDIFYLVCPAITVNAADATEGTVSVEADGASEQLNAAKTYLIPAANTLTLTAAPAQGYLFSKWVDAGGATLSTEATYQFAASEDIEVSAVFEADAPVPTEDKEVTADDAETGDAAYLTVTVKADDATAAAPVWSIGTNTVTAQALNIEVAADATTPEISISDGGSITADRISIKRTVKADEWAFMSLPFAITVDNGSIQVGGAAAVINDNIKFLVYDGALRASSSIELFSGSGWTAKESGTIDANTGFAVAINSNNGDEQIVTFSATSFSMDASDKAVSLESHEATVNGGIDADWNFKGNPMLQSASKGDNYSLYIYNPSDDTYSEYAAAETATFSPFAAWFVQSTGLTNRTITFSHDGTTVAADVESNIDGRFAISINGGEDEARITVLNGSSESYVINEDAMYFAPNSNKVAQVYLIDADGAKIASSVVPAPYNEVKLAYKAAVAGAQTLTVTSVIPGTAVYLVDNEEGTETLMNEGSEYSFTSESGLNSERFAVKTIIDVTGIEESTAETSSVSAVVTGDAVKIYGATAGETIDVYTVNGVMVSSAVAVEGENEISVPAQGVLIVKVGDEVVKIVK